MNLQVIECCTQAKASHRCRYCAPDIITGLSLAVAVSEAIDDSAIERRAAQKPEVFWRCHRNGGHVRLVRLRPCPVGQPCYCAGIWAMSTLIDRGSDGIRDACRSAEHIVKPITGKH